MTIPSRPAPAPPKNNVNRTNQNHNNSSSHYGATSSTTSARYTPTTNWDDTPFENDYFEMPSTNIVQSKKSAPPRPPPPKFSAQALKKPTQQTSINILSNLFGKPKQQTTSTKSGNYGTTATTKLTPFSTVPPKLPAPPNSSSHHHQYGTSAAINESVELISFDSPPHSPTFTQKSISDCTSSIGSFNSDTTNCSPQNGGNVSQGESGFEDDFTSSIGYVNTAWDNNDPFSPPPKPTVMQKPLNVGGSSFFIFDKNKKRNIPVVIDDPLCNGKSLLPPQPALIRPTIIKPFTSKPSIIKHKPKLYVSF